MPQGWRFIARYVGWPTRCAKNDDDRLLEDAASAFIDRAPIDWAALLNRARSAEHRAIVENLRRLESARASVRPDGTQPHSHRLTPVLARLVIALAAVQTTGSLLLVAIATFDGVPIRHLASQIVLAVAFTAAAAMLAATASRDARRLFLLAMFLATASAFARGALGGLPNVPLPPIEAALRGIWPEAFAPACLWQFALDFPRVRRFTRFDRLARRIAAAAWLFGVVAFALNVGVAYVSLDERAFAAFLPNSPTNVFWRIFTLAELLAIGAILLRSRRAPAAEQRKVARFSAALAACASPFLLMGLARTLVPAVDAWLRTARPSDRIWLDYLIVAALTAMPILTTTAVVVDRPFELQLVLRRTWRYAAARGGLTTVLAAPFVLLFLTLYSLRDLAITQIFSSSRGGFVAACACAACLVLAVRSGLFDMLDRRRFRWSAAQHRLVTRAIDRIRLARGHREVGAVVADELRVGTGAATVRMLGLDQRNCFADPLSVVELPADSALAALLRESSDVVDLSADGSLFPLLPQDDRRWLGRHAVELAAPLRRQDGALTAIVTLGLRRGSGTFDRRDRWLVATLTAAAAAAWESDPSAEAMASASDRSFARREPAFECPRCGLVVESPVLPCGCPSEPILASLPLRLGGQFLVERRIGAGGMGVVYLARDARLGREVALKTLPQLRRGTTARLRHEARAMAALSHEGLATIYGLELWRRIPVLVMEYFPAGTLADRLERARLTTDAAIRLAMAILQPLAYMHERGVLHGDVKPSNVALTASGAPRLLDFGLASMFTEGCRNGEVAPAGVQVAGTIPYLPPEAFTGAPPAPSFDLWAVSVILQDMTADDYDGRLKAFFERALAPEPRVRFQTSADMQLALQTLIRST